MDHKRIYGIKPSSVILSQKCNSKLSEVKTQKVPRQADAKKDRIINTQQYNFNRSQLSGKSVFLLFRDSESEERVIACKVYKRVCI